jgi:tetratricopeptide (TPR) repeat protein
MSKAPFFSRWRAEKAIDAAHTHYERNDLEGAWALLEGSLKDDPESATAHFLMGRIANDRKQPHVALPHLKQAVAGAPNHADAYAELGRAHHELRQRPDAEAAYTRSLELKNDPYTAINFATLLRDSGRFAEATELYKRALSAPGLDAETRMRIQRSI